MKFISGFNFHPIDFLYKLFSIFLDSLAIFNSHSNAKIVILTMVSYGGEQ